MQSKKIQFSPAGLWPGARRFAGRALCLSAGLLCLYYFLACLRIALKVQSTSGPMFVLDYTLFFVPCLPAFFGLVYLAHRAPPTVSRLLCLLSAVGLALIVARATYTYQFFSENLYFLVKNVDADLAEKLIWYEAPPKNLFLLALAALLWFLLHIVPDWGEGSPPAAVCWAWLTAFALSLTLMPEFFASDVYARHYKIVVLTVVLLCGAGIGLAIRQASRALMVFFGYCLPSSLFWAALNYFYLAMLRGAHPILWYPVPTFFLP